VAALLLAGGLANGEKRMTRDSHPLILRKGAYKPDAAPCLQQRAGFTSTSTTHIKRNRSHASCLRKAPWSRACEVLMLLMSRRAPAGGVSSVVLTFRLAAFRKRPPFVGEATWHHKHRACAKAAAPPGSRRMCLQSASGNPPQAPKKPAQTTMGVSPFFRKEQPAQEKCNPSQQS